jgi:hypothetical protein
MYDGKSGVFMKSFILMCLALFSTCLAQQPRVMPIPIGDEQPPKPPIEKPKKLQRQYKQSVEEKLKSYFYGREIVPSIIVNNTERDQTEIRLENHKIEWIRGEKETKIKINDDLFTLKDKRTINGLQDQDNFEAVDFANNWEQIKFYKFGDRQLIGISMGNEPCTGIGCRVAFQLIYDFRALRLSHP